MKQVMSRILFYGPISDQPTTVEDMLRTLGFALLAWAAVTIAAMWAVM